MKVFVTGASGFVGSAVTRELIAHGHTVLGLARSSASADRITALGATAHLGSLDDLESLTAGAAQADAVIHTAFIHDFASPTHDPVANCAKDVAAFRALVAGVRGTDKPVVATNGSIGGVPGEELKEGDDKQPNPRKEIEDIIRALGKEGVRAINIRLPPTVHGPNDPNFIPALIGGAKRNGFAMYVEDGSARWPSVHVKDAAVLYRLAIEKQLAPGTFLHAWDNVLVSTKDIAELIAKKTGVLARSVSQGEAAQLYGFIGYSFGLDSPLSNAETVRLTGWQAEEISLLEDLETGDYF